MAAQDRTTDVARSTDSVAPPVVDSPRRNPSSWARPVKTLRASDSGEHPRDLVDGRRPMGAIQGFGRLWQKTYRVRLEGAPLSPAQVVSVWRERFSEFWPSGNRFFAPLTGIAPGEVALLSVKAPGGIRLSTGILVLYVDEESFTFMTPEGHMFAGWITFSAFVADGSTVAQAQMLVRAQDPLGELGLLFGGHRVDDRFWLETLGALAAHLGIEATPTAQVVCVDPRRQWSRLGNIRYDAGIRNSLHLIGAPVRWLRRGRVERRG